MSIENLKIGIFGGTFDPIHLGHLIIAQRVCDEYLLDKIIFIPSGTPPHKRGRSITNAVHRYNMLKEAIALNAKFEISRLELDREGYTYTIDTLKQLKLLYGTSSMLYFITGADVIHDLCTWKDYTTVFEMCEFIAANRPGYSKQSLLSEIRVLNDKYNAKINISETLLVDISSTELREMVRMNKSIKYLVPEPVETYIFENNLYKSEI